MQDIGLWMKNYMYVEKKYVNINKYKRRIVVAMIVPCLEEVSLFSPL